MNLDGVLLNDTFSPVIHRFVTRRGGTYTVDVERAVFSQPQLVACGVLGAAVGSDAAPEQIRAEYFAEREEYLAERPVRVLEGAVELVARLRSLGLRTVCYGGLERGHFDRHLGAHAALFDDPAYVCTNDFRPGVREIAELFGLPCDRTLFIDDVAGVGQAAQESGASFIGHPSDFEHGFQRSVMRALGVRHLVDGPDRIDEELIRLVDAEAAARAAGRPGALCGRPAGV
ncbi:HAD family hydrolase [Streptomyces fragilis]|uniref:HAD family phosphatase n=1 Tax=Streptomyces fragilis TaxID=67301 RepID=A0ABV2YEX8_9ACTN|nr:HAD family phosphatase [Streptomyces fragilis]